MPMTIKQAMNLREMSPEEADEYYYSALEETKTRIMRKEYERSRRRD